MNSTNSHELLPYSTFSRFLVIIIAIAVVLLTMIFVFYDYSRIKKDLDTIRARGQRKEMVRIGDDIRNGADTFIQTEFKRIILVAALLAILISLFIEKTSGLTFALGALMSSFLSG